MTTASTTATKVSPEATKAAAAAGTAISIYAATGSPGIAFWKQFIDAKPTSLAQAVILAANMGEGPDYVAIFDLRHPLVSDSEGNDIVLQIAKQYETARYLQFDDRRIATAGPEFGNYRARLHDLVLDIGRRKKPAYVTCIRYDEYDVVWDSAKKRWDLPKPETGTEVSLHSTRAAGGFEQFLEGPHARTTYEFLQQASGSARIVTVSDGVFENMRVSGYAVFDAIRQKKVAVAGMNEQMRKAFADLDAQTVKETEKLSRQFKQQTEKAEIIISV